MYIRWLQRLQLIHHPAIGRIPYTGFSTQGLPGIPILAHSVLDRFGRLRSTASRLCRLPVFCFTVFRVHENNDAGTVVCLLPVSISCRTDVHVLSVGHSADGSRFPRNIFNRRSKPPGDIFISLVTLPPQVYVRHFKDCKR